MTQFRLAVDDAILQRYPDYTLVVIYAEGIHNGPSNEASEAYLRDAENYQRKALTSDQLSLHPHIAAWRKTYSSFGLKPNKYPCSAEALLKRILKGQNLPRINRLVDFYNAISVRYVLPVGGEDRDRVESDVVLKEAAGTEPFIARINHEEVTTYPEPGEIIWADRAGVTCRAWNWRQGHRTMLTEATRNAYFVFDRLAPLPMADLRRAEAELTRILREEAQADKVWSEIFGASG
jgi:DNA/RNA-binding domain of Phe-tRNA-synthetase-like protein